MRANRKFIHDEKAQVGIGTMIVFIATVLVAAVAAGVLIDVSGKLQERSSRTGQEATEEVSGNFNVVSIVGRRDAASGNLDDLDLYMAVAPGAPNMDVSQLRIQYKNPTQHLILAHADDATPDANEFNASQVRDQDDSFNDVSNQWVVNGGDLVKITVDLDAAVNNAELAPRTQVTLILVPEFGNKIEIGFLSPASYGTQTKVILK